MKPNLLSTSGSPTRRTKAKQPNYKDFEIKTPNKYMRQIIHVSASITTWKDNLNIFFVNMNKTWKALKCYKNAKSAIDTLNVSSDAIYSIKFEVLEINYTSSRFKKVHTIRKNLIFFKQRFKCEVKNEKAEIFFFNFSSWTSFHHAKF
ncbi:hypothetical protein BpHYR1_040998 [Brachionus plicatilis]|uniref:Uncharacterized protein n=1 Tax=Brachionus plicatilis TaxID=10195 RepID=A0A3M7PBD3_BRAPC|nr:hypothetical protein BpHYR1_040998 [Brachionus plicatilis]